MQVTNGLQLPHARRGPWEPQKHAIKQEYAFPLFYCTLVVIRIDVVVIQPLLQSEPSRVPSLSYLAKCSYNMSVPSKPPETIGHNDVPSPITVDMKSYATNGDNGLEAATGNRSVAADKLARKLSARQVQMIAIGGTIGTGLFLGTGKSLATGGPASMLIGYAIVGAIVFITMLSLGEMAAFVPVAGSFCTFAG